MPSYDPSKLIGPNADLKRVTWLELFFDVIFALALTMSAKPLEGLTEYSMGLWKALAEFLVIYIFLVIFWYRHTSLVNRFRRSSFLMEVLTLLTGFLVIAFIQFIGIWKVNAEIGSYLATVTIFLVSLSVACIYFVCSLRIVDAGENEKRWARASARYMLWESIGYLTAIIAAPEIRPYWFMAVFIYFNRFPVINWLNPKAVTTIPPELQNIPPENLPHKSERVGLFALMVYGLIVVLAAIPLMEIDVSSTEGALTPIIIFGKMLLFISVIWFIHYRLFDIAQPKGNQFNTMTFITLALLVASTAFMRLLLTNHSPFIELLFAITTGLLFSLLATKYWNIQSMAGVSISESVRVAFRRWAYFLYIFATAFFASIFFPYNIKLIIWESVVGLIFLGLLLDKGLSATYYMGTKMAKARRYFDAQTVSALSFVVIGIIAFFAINVLLRKPTQSWWLLTWLAPLALGLFLLLNHWLFKRIRPI